jgi:hypothetical protein
MMPDENMVKITPDELMNIFGFSPADNTENLQTALPWKSKLIGQQIRSLFDYKSVLDTVSKEMWILGPFTIAALWQRAILDSVLRHVKASARLAVGASRNPDAIADINGWIYKSYSRLLYTLTGFLSRTENSTGIKPG